MRTSTSSLVIGLWLLCLTTVISQVSSTEPKNWKSASPIGLGSSSFLHDEKLAETVRQEILDTNIIELIARAVNLSVQDRTLFQLASSGGNDVWLYRLNDKWSDGCDRFTEKLGAYIQARGDGHTRDCLLNGITNRQSISVIKDPDLRILATNYPIMPVSWFKRGETGTTTNKAGQVASRSMSMSIVNGKQVLQTNYTHIPKVDEICRWVSYSLVDGEIAWNYHLQFKADGSLDNIHASKFDAKETDPKLEAVFKAVGSEVDAEMKQQSAYGKLGAVHTYWWLKKERLKARGIDWKSPAELNQGTIYD